MDQNFDVVLLASAPRTANIQSDQQENLDAAGIIMLLTITSGSATGGLMPQIRILNLATGVDEIITSIPVPVRAIGTYSYHFYPGANRRQIACYFSSGIRVPRFWRLQMTADDASPITYSVGCNYVRGG